MAYPQEIVVGALVEVSNSTVFAVAQNITQAAALFGSVSITYPMMVQKAAFRITTATSDITNSVVELQKITLANVTTSIALITVPTGTAVGKLVYKDCTPAQVNVGDKLQWRLKTQGGLGGTPAGAGIMSFLAALQPEIWTNQTNAVVSV